MHQGKSSKSKTASNIRWTGLKKAGQGCRDKTHGEVSLESGGWPTIFSKLGSPSAGQKLHSEAVSF